MFDPESNEYQRTDDGVPEYGNVILTLDPALARLPGDLVVQKMVFGTDSPAQALVNLFSYYGEPDLANRGSSMELMMAAGRADNPVFVYTNERNTELVMGMATYGLALMHPSFGNGSMLLTNEKLQEVAAKAQASQFEQRGGFCPLQVIAFEVGEQPEPRPPEPKQGAAPAEPVRRPRKER